MSAIKQAFITITESLLPEEALQIFWDTHANLWLDVRLSEASKLNSAQ
jgi:hypothetical protein